MMKDLIDRILNYFSYEEMLDSAAMFLINFASAAGIFLLFFFFWKLLNRILNVVFRKAGVDLTVQSFVRNISKNVIYIIGFVTALSQVGINTSSILASLGVAGLTIGFAARDALSNIISGLFIFWDRPFVIGDLIEINDKYGRVESITMRSTRVSTVDGKMLAIPNTQVVNSMLASYTNFPNLRLDIAFTVAVSENISNVKRLCSQIISDDERFKHEPEPDLVVNKINDYNIELIFRAWINDEKKHISMRYELREKILEAMLQNNVNMPFETLSLVMEKN